MTKRALFASCAIFLAGAMPAAADYNWTGLYIGAHAGGAWGDVDVTGISETTTFVNYGAPPVTVPFGPDGVLGGGQIGYNFAWANWLIGFEGTIAGLDFDESVLNPLAADEMSIDMDWLATASLRLGGNWYDCLWYLKGGYAAGEVQTHYNDTVAGGDPVGFYSTEETHHGYVVGAGVERFIGEQVTFGIEYNFIDLGETDHRAVASDTGTIVADVDAQMHTVTARLNWLLYNP